MAVGMLIFEDVVFRESEEVGGGGMDTCAQAAISTMTNVDSIALQKNLNGI